MPIVAWEVIDLRSRRSQREVRAARLAVMSRDAPALVAAAKKIQAIRRYCELTCTGRKESKHYTERP